MPRGQQRCWISSRTSPSFFFGPSTIPIVTEIRKDMICKILKFSKSSAVPVFSSMPCPSGRRSPPTNPASGPRPRISPSKETPIFIAAASSMNCQRAANTQEKPPQTLLGQQHRRHSFRGRRKIRKRLFPLAHLGTRQRIYRVCSGMSSGRAYLWMFPMWWMAPPMVSRSRPCTEPRQSRMKQILLHHKNLLYRGVYSCSHSIGDFFAI